MGSMTVNDLCVYDIRTNYLNSVLRFVKGKGDDNMQPYVVTRKAYSPLFQKAQVDTNYVLDLKSNYS